MPRQSREMSEKRVYHVMLRGNNRESIFKDDEDKTRIIDTLADKKQGWKFCLFAFCVMDNHIHLVIKEGNDHLSRIIKRSGTSYAYYFNKKYRRIGHVFQDRYRSEKIDDDSYLLTAIRYVHQNPLKAGNGSIEGYKWSSYGEYINQKDGVVDTKEILTMISSDSVKAVREFARFNHELSDEVFIDIGENKEIDESNVEIYVRQYLENRNIMLGNLKDPFNRHIRDELIRHLLERSNLSRRGIAVVLGLGRETVRKLGS